MTTCTVCELHAESTFKIEGMDCREEVAMLERRFKNLPGLEDFSADLMGQRLHVTYDAARLTALSKVSTMLRISERWTVALPLPSLKIPFRPNVVR